MIAWFIVPYRTRGAMERYCAMDDFSDLIAADGGRWSEAECLGNHAVVKVRASSATLQTINAEPGFTRIPVALLDDPLSSLSSAQKTAIRNKLLDLGYPLQEIQERFPNADLGEYTLRDVLVFALRRRFRPRYDETTASIVLDGPQDPTVSVDVLNSLVGGD